MYSRALTKTDKTPFCGQNPSGFNKSNDGWSYESKLSTPIRHYFYWCSKLHLAHNRAINIKNIWQKTTQSIGCLNRLRASGCFLCLSPSIFSEWHIVPLGKYRQSCRELALVRLYIYVRQVEDSENIYGVLFVFVKAPHLPPKNQQIKIFIGLIFFNLAFFHYFCNFKILHQRQKIKQELE